MRLNAPLCESSYIQHLASHMRSHDHSVSHMRSHGQPFRESHEVT